MRGEKGRSCFQLLLGDDHRVLDGEDPLNGDLALSSFSEVHLLIHLKSLCNRWMNTGQKDKKDKRTRRTER